MSLAMTAFVSGIMGVSVVMIVLQIMVNLSSKLAIRLEKRESPDKN